MKTVLILRHAKSSWKDLSLADHQRPLNGRGRRDAPRMGRLLRDEDLLPDLIISSTAVRALSTAKLAADAAGYEEEIRTTRNLYHADPDEYIDVLQGVDDGCERVMVVGHNPGMEYLVEELTGVAEQMTTAALAQVTLPIARWRDLTSDTEGELANHWRPRDLQ